MKIRGRWLDGSAQVVAEEDPSKHLRRQRNKISAATVRLVGTQPVAIRVEFD
jgi:hypothetical protein